MTAPDPELIRDGATRITGLIADELTQWHDLTRRYFAMGKPGVRIVDDRNLHFAIERLLDKPLLSAQLGPGEWHCVRAICFDKAPDSNWALAWHQDRTIAVTEKIDVPGFGPWSIKDGITHVEPPFELMDGLRTLRLHLDDVSDENGALLVSPGSQLVGKISDRQAAEIASRNGAFSCHAQAGDAWLYATPILHGSARSSKPSRRRVLQLDFSKEDLTSPLQWRGIS